ncbi:hypothetical protein IJJ08_04205 [bacterium]|nr:hypothetical protein [bacterium]
MDIKFVYAGLAPTMGLMRDSRLNGSHLGWQSVPWLMTQLPAGKDVLKSSVYLSQQEIYRQLQEYACSQNILIGERLLSWRQAWQSIRPACERILSDFFGESTQNLCNDVRASLVFFPDNSYYLPENRFFLYIDQAPASAAAICVRELTRCLWFYIWQRHFGDDAANYQPGHWPWLLGELTRELIWTNPDWRAYEPEFFAALDPGVNLGCGPLAQLTINGEPLLQSLQTRLQDHIVQEYMEAAIAWLESLPASILETS